MNKIIEIKDLNFHYDQQTHAVKNVSFSIEKGSYTTIIGHNGSGKSTIAKLIIGLLEKESGKIIVDNLELNQDNLYKIRNKVGIVFQNPDNQFIGSTVRDDIAFGLENHQVESSLMDGIINKFASKVNMEKYLDHEPTKLSGGQKQRVAIAGVLAMTPDIIVFDESTSMLDPTGKAEINKVIKELHHESNITIMSITHDVEEVAKSDYVIVMDNGRLVLQGKPQDVFEKEDFLISMQLDVPFSVHFANLLKNKGIVLNDKCDLEGMVDQLCQLNLKK